MAKRFGARRLSQKLIDASTGEGGVVESGTSSFKFNFDESSLGMGERRSTRDSGFAIATSRLNRFGTIVGVDDGEGAADVFVPGSGVGVSTGASMPVRAGNSVIERERGREGESGVVFDVLIGRRTGDSAVRSTFNAAEVGNSVCFAGSCLRFALGGSTDSVTFGSDPLSTNGEGASISAPLDGGDGRSPGIGGAELSVVIREREGTAAVGVSLFISSVGIRFSEDEAGGFMSGASTFTPSSGRGGASTIASSFIGCSGKGGEAAEISGVTGIASVG
jgi:hypothetical protein